MANLGIIRRTVFFIIVIVTTIAAVGLIATVFKKDGGLTSVEAVMVILYAILFSWICISFWTSVFGFFVCLTGRNRYAISNSLKKVHELPVSSKLSKTAIIMPVYNEETSRIFAGIKAMQQSLVRTQYAEAFDFFILSDTREASTWIEEELRWFQASQENFTPIKIYYRNRIYNTSRKSGNIADFCRNWGGHYKYCVVADADSVICGDTLVKMVQMMDLNPNVALIQTPPVPVNRESLFSRVLQFASSMYGKIATSGLSYWQMGESNYWGHNAILRIKPWVDHCGLPKLAGKEPFGGEILSHDFVEAGLLKKAGWDCWFAYDLEGSYEEIPPTLIDYAKRDRRWCQGNLQHSKLVMTQGFHPLNRLHLIMGIMSYAASPLWLIFIIISGIEAYWRSLSLPLYFVGDNWFPIWPVSYYIEMTTVLLVTLIILFLPKFLSLFLIFINPEQARGYGGIFKATLSVMIETIYSILLAPVMMLFQTKFVLAILMRRNVAWVTQNRSDHSTSLGEAVLTHGMHTLVGIAAGIVTYIYVPTFFWWLTPVLFGLLCSIPMSILISKVSTGLQAKRWGLFLTPEEVSLPPVLCDLKLAVEEEGRRSTSASEFAHLDGLLRVIFDPTVNALHLSLLEDRSTTKRQQLYLESLIFKLIEDGEDSLTLTEKRELLTDMETMKYLHILAWSDCELFKKAPLAV